MTYDDPQSLQVKARYAKQVGIAGVNFWDIHRADYDDWVLVTTVRSALAHS